MTELTYLPAILLSSSLMFKTECMTGIPKAKVLPVPVFARTTIPFSEVMNSLIHCSCTGVRVGPTFLMNAFFRAGCNLVSSTTLEVMTLDAPVA